MSKDSEELGNCSQGADEKAEGAGILIGACEQTHGVCECSGRNMQMCM